jgi:moderate conductance mechanosensitive channel
MSCRPESYTPNLPRQAGRGAIRSCLFTPHERGEKRARITAVRYLFALLLCLLAALASGAKAAEPAPVSADELERLVHSLQNETEREKLIEQLHGLIAAQRGAEKEKPAGAAFFNQVTQQVEAFSGEILAGAAMVVDAPLLLEWASEQASDHAARRLWADAAFAFTLIFGCAALAEWVLRAIMARLLPRLPVRRSDTRLVRVSFALLGLILAALPIAAFAVAAYTVLPAITEPLTHSRITLTVLVNATVEARFLLCVAKWVVLPADSGTVFLPIDPETRNYVYIWVRRFTFWGIFGYALPEAAWWLGIPGALYALLLKTVGLVLAVLAIIFILQNRMTVAAWIAGEPKAASSGWSRVRRTLGETWHLLAILYITGAYLIYALHMEGGFTYVLRATLLSLILIIAARLLVSLVQRWSRRGFAIKPELKAQFPTLEQRANRYIPILTGLVSVVIYFLALLAVLQAWNIAAFAWFGSDLGRRMTGHALAIGIVLVIALALWEVSASAIERYLSAIDARDVPRRTRIRTLLPLLQTALLGVIIVVTSLMILSHLGIDIAPLLAGAGVVGLAIGFGSQALVKDIITGLFILLEDQIAVGDIVDVGKDHKGVVEAITVRTIRMRDVSGTVHTVPFSEVTSVKNLSKDFSYAIARIAISYREDIDRVVEILRGVSNQLAQDETLKSSILNPFEYMGVDALDESSVVLLVRIRTLPGKQLAVSRTFNRLVKIAFDEHRIVSRDPSPVAIQNTPGSLDDSAAASDATPRRRLA